ncbi:MAG: L-rhamnose/proton symporter RhaT [Tepidisphaeraceae bacterium]
MITPNPLLGTLFHAIGACSSSACYTPQKKVKRWSWQTYWLVQASFCWLILPVVGAVLTIPHLGTVLSEAPRSAMLYSFLLGMAYGVGGTAFGLSIRYIGFSLTYAIAVGLSSILGTLIPPLLSGELKHIFGRAGGVYVLGGILIGTLGIAVTGAAGKVKENALRTKAGSDLTPGIEPAAEPDPVAIEAAPAAAEPQFSIGIGLMISLVAGVLSAFYGFALNAGQPIADVAAAHGADVWQGNVVYIFANSGAFLTTLIYCTVLHLKNRTAGEFVGFAAAPPDADGERPSLVANYLLATLTGCLWYGQFFFYNLGHVRMGDYKFSSWCLHMTMLVLFSGLIALLLREWSRSPRLAKSLFAGSMALLVIGVLVLSYGNYIGGGAAGH